MELMIDFTCPRCHLIAKQRLIVLRPGHPRRCQACQIPLELTNANLRTLSRDLESYCRE